MGADHSLVGRDAELAALTGLLGVQRLVTITGAGGVGKTRLALAMAAQTSDAAICLLARQNHPDQVAAAVAESLGYPSWEAAVVGIADRSALLVLDNCEHLLDAAADAVELLVSAGQRRWWLVLSRSAGADVCDTDPGFPLSVWLETEVPVLTRVWLGDMSWSAALRSGSLRVTGDATACRALPGWLDVSPLAAVERAAVSLPR